jgi:hypothetical protein
MSPIRIRTLVIGAATLSVAGMGLALTPAGAADIQPMLRAFAIVSCTSSTPCEEYDNTAAGAGLKGPTQHRVVSYAPTEAEPVREDNGSAQLINGVAHVRLDPAFANVIDTHKSYLVFITPEGNSHGLYVTDKTAAGFTAHENMGGTSTLAFDYRIVAKPFGVTAPRLPMLTMPRAPAGHSMPRPRHR